MVLHITNDYSGSTVYRNLIKELDDLGVSQIVYNPIRDRSRIDRNRIYFAVPESRIIYSPILNSLTDRIFYKRKVKRIARDLQKSIDFSKIDIVHAHTWYSDGGVAYVLKRIYQIPYIVTIRNTDLNFFQKYLIHQRSFGRKILEEAEKVILISASYKHRILNESSLQIIRDRLISKLRVVPNGVDSYWIENLVGRKGKLSKNIFSILFIGKFNRGKNILALQSAINIINRDKRFVHLHLIGGGGDVHNAVLRQVQRNSQTMTYYGEIFDLSQLKKYFEIADIFAMPSRYETFGLVYVEAMLQGLPILYTDGEGIDGLYQEKIGEKVQFGTVEEIKEKLLILVENYSSYVIPTKRLVKNHSWKKIALVYYDLYGFR